MQHASQILNTLKDMRLPSERKLHDHARADCSICGGLGYVGYDVPYGHAKFGKTEICQCWSATAESIRRENLSELANMYADELAITLDDLKSRNDTTAEMISAAHKFNAGDMGMLTLCGGVGLGKSATLCAIVNAANTVDYGSGYYVRFVDLMNIIRKGFSDNTSDSRYRRLIDIPVLAIDELDKAKNSEWAEEFRTLFLDDRYRQARNKKTKTALAMNGEASQLPDHLYDRLRWGEKIDGGFRIVKVTGTSARPAGL